MDLQKVGSSCSPSELGQGFHKRHALDVAHSPTELNDAYIWLVFAVIDRHPGYSFDPVLDRVCDVGYDLYRLAEIVASSLTLYNVLINFASSNIVLAG
jgi:hypothetical protein